MKRYEAICWRNKKKSALYSLNEMNGNFYNGTKIAFRSFSPSKSSCRKYKNNLANGIDIRWWTKNQNLVFINWKKNKLQGIKISFITFK